jgi:hypothetical protein
VGRVDVVRIHIDGHGEIEKNQCYDDDILIARPQAHRTYINSASWFLNPRSNYPHGIGVGQPELQRVLELSENAQIIWFFKLRTANMFPRWEWPGSVVDVDDVPSLFERSVLETSRMRSERLRTLMRLWSWRRRERLLGERFTALTVCSEADRQYLRRLGVRAPMHVAPNAFERPNTVPVRIPCVPPRIGFMGVLDHEPNLLGIQWFVRHCWPQVKREVPDARLRLVGRYSDGPLKPRGTDVDGLGWVDDPTAEMATWSTMVVPIHIGAGTRGKIAHAFSQKCPVVSTPLGAHGYEPCDGHNMFLAGSADAFAAACVKAIRRPAAAALLAERAWQQYLDRWTWDAVNPYVWSAAEDCLRAQSR